MGSLLPSVYMKGKGSLAGLFVGDDFNEYLMDYILGLNYITETEELLKKGKQRSIYICMVDST